MGQYTEVSELIKYKSARFYRATATPENIWEHLQLIWYTFRYPKTVQFRISMPEETWNKTVPVDSTDPK